MERGVTRCHLSISHEREMAVAVCILEDKMQLVVSPAQMRSLEEARLRAGAFLPFC